MNCTIKNSRYITDLLYLFCEHSSCTLNCANMCVSVYLFVFIYQPADGTVVS